MDTGIGFFATHDAIGPAQLARLVEDHGHAALYFPEHSHIPASRASPYPGGGDLPRKYAHTYDLFVALTAAATATSKLRIGSGICLVVERDPIHTAKEVASVDHLSGGRFEFGVGAGWNREEMANHGTDARVRMKIMRERVEAMKAIWTSDEASYAGEHVAFERIWSWPKPAQWPHPPVLVGGNGPTVLDRVVSCALRPSTPADARTSCRSSSRSTATASTTPSTTSPSAHPSCGGSTTSLRTRGSRCSPTSTTTATGAACGGCAPTAARACSTRTAARRRARRSSS
jgi:probable F420-dependent oxidoreductase